MRVPDPKANTTTEAYLAYKAGYLEESELKPVLYEPYLHFDGWLAYWAGLTIKYPGNKNLFFGLSSTQFGITGTLSKDGVVSVSGTATTTDGAKVLLDGDASLKAGTYTLSISEPQNSVVNMIVNTNGGVSIPFRITAGSTSATNTIPEGSVGVAAGLYYGITNGTTYNESFKVQFIAGDAPDYDLEPYTANPEMLCDEEALVAYLSGVTDTYPEDIKDPYDVRIVGYLRHLASIRWPEPDYPVNNEEFYLSTMEPTHTSNSEPSSNIELDTAEGKIISVEAYGDTYQQTYSGKNLLRNTFNSPSTVSGVTFTKNPDGTITASGTATAGINFYPNGNVFYPISEGTYTLSDGLPNPTATTYFTYIDTNTSTPNYIYFNTAEGAVTRTIPEGITIKPRIVIRQGQTLDNVVFKLMLEQGSTATSFEPYVGSIPAPNPDYPQDIDVVTGEQIVTVTGKNLFDKVAEVATSPNYSLNPDGSITTNASNAQTGRRYMTLTMSPGTYTLSFRPYFSGVENPAIRFTIRNMDTSTDYIVKNINNPENGSLQVNSFTVENTTSVGFCIIPQARLENGQTFYFDDTQLEEGSTTTAYEPYQSQSYTIDLGSIELCKIDDYRDNIFNNDPNEDWYNPDLEDNAWYVHKKVGTYTFDGTESWVAAALGDGYVFYTTVITDYATQNNVPISKYFSGASNVASYGGTPHNSVAFINLSGQTTPRFYVRYMDNFSSVSEIRTFMGANRPTIYYALETPTDTKITDATLIGQLNALAGADTYNEKTFIKVTANDPNLPALLKVEAYKY